MGARAYAIRGRATETIARAMCGVMMGCALTITEKPITLQVAVERAARNLVKILPPAPPVGASR